MCTNILDAYQHLFTPTVNDLLQKLKTFDQGTYFHSLQTTSYYIDFCQYYSFNNFLTSEILYSVLFHDIGKLLLPSSIIQKKSTLTSHEWSVLKKHPQYSLSYLSKYPEIKVDPFLILYHHRNIDGSGYPLTRTTVDITDQTKILRIVDSFEAMTASRPYGVVYSFEEALYELKKCAGKYYDARYILLFTSYIKDKILFIESLSV